jgi:TRAP-type C4-dicarboxylate transport system permease small subunit
MKNHLKLHSTKYIMLCMVIASIAMMKYGLLVYDETINAGFAAGGRLESRPKEVTLITSAFIAVSGFALLIVSALASLKVLRENEKPQN